jgi:hypothetical protein
MLKDYRSWLDAELKILENTGDHEYSFGQARLREKLRVAIEEMGRQYD